MLLSSAISVVVDNADGLGKVVVAGDLFENESDLKDEQVWLDAGSEDPEMQRRNRERVLQIADWIVPGHGDKFQVKR